MSKLEVQPSEEHVVPERVSRVEPVGQSRGGQATLGLARHPLHPRPENLDYGIIRVHRPCKIEVAFGALEVTRMKAYVARVECTRGSIGSSASACSARSMAESLCSSGCGRTPEITSVE